VRLDHALCVWVVLLDPPHLFPSSAN
jgi:hypothetical protein